MESTLGKKKDIYDELLEEITQLKILPGETIKENDLSERFRVSRTPLREILKKLEIEGYLKVMPRYGTKVTLINPDSVNQVLEMRIQLESKVYKELLLSITEAQISELEKELEDQFDAFMKGDVDRFWLLDNRFHSLIFHYASKDFWWEIIKKYEAHYMRYRWLAMKEDKNIEILYIQHKNLLSIIKERKIELIESELKAHIGFCMEKLPLLKHKYPEYFTA